MELRGSQVTSLEGNEGKGKGEGTTKAKDIADSGRSEQREKSVRLLNDPNDQMNTSEAVEDARIDTSRGEGDAT